MTIYNCQVLGESGIRHPHQLDNAESCPIQIQRNILNTFHDSLESVFLALETHNNFAVIHNPCGLESDLAIHMFCHSVARNIRQLNRIV